MKSFLDYSTTRPQNPDIVWIRLSPENDNEKKLLDENTDTETIELYYHAAVTEKLPGYSLLRVVDNSQWPNAAQLSVQKAEGFGQ